MVEWILFGFAISVITIKLIIPEHEDGKLLTRKELKDLDIFKNEVGIFYSKEEGNESLSFRGVIDVKNEESGEFVSMFTTSRPWIESEEAGIDLDFKKFHDFWDNETYQIGSITCKIEPLSDKLLEYFEQIAQKDEIELKKLPVLRTEQEKAVEGWLDNGGIGIFEMCTGAGKTITAMGCIKELEEKHDKLLVIVAAPYTNLVDQWEEATKKWYLDPPAIILDKTWKQRLFREIHSLVNEEKNLLCKM